MQNVAVRAAMIFNLLLFSTVATFANVPLYFTFQTKILLPTGQPLELANVSFRFTILDSVGTCALYVEDFNSINMAGSSGVASFSLGSGSKQYPPVAVSMYEVFNNQTAFFPCQAGGTYSPSTSDKRQIVMQFNDGSGWQTLPQMAINSVPFSNYANRAENLGDYTAADYLRPATLPTCAAGQALRFDGTVFTCIAASGGGGGSVTSVSGTLPISVSSGTSTPVISIAASSATTAGYLSSNDWTTFNNKLGTATSFSGDVTGTYNATVLSATGVGAGTYSKVTVDTKGRVTTATNINSSDVTTALGYTPSNTNGTVTSVTGNGPISVTNTTTTPSISIAQATVSANGYLSSTDFTTFNNKLGTGTTFSGDVTGTYNATTLVTTGVGAGTYSKVTVDTKGRVTTATNINSSDVTTALGYTPLNSATAFVQNGNSFSADATLGTSDNFKLSFKTNNTTRMTFDTAGNVGIGTTGPLSQLEVTATSSALPRGILSTQYSSNGDGAFLIGAKARGTVGSPAAIQNGDTVTAFMAMAFDGSGLVAPGALGFVSNGTVAAGSVPTDFIISTGAVNGGTERLRVTSAGNVGIGTTTPIAKLAVNGSIRAVAGAVTSLYTSDTDLTIDFSTSNVVTTSASCGSTTLSGMQDGGSYTLVVTGSSSGTCTFTHTGVTGFKFSPANGATDTASGGETVYTFLKVGTKIYITWVTGMR